MLAQDRQKKIIELLYENGSVQVSNLTDILAVSVETVRRDLEALEKENKLERVHGGAILGDKKLESFNVRTKEYLSEKIEIAHIASKLIKENQSIAMDSSTTNLEMSKILKNNFNNLTIITNSLLISYELANSGFNIILTGGKLVPEQYSFVGNMALQNISNFYVDIAFISTSGVSLNSGFTDFNINDVDIQRKMIEIADKAYLLADHSKFEKTALIKVSDFDSITAIISDSKLSKSISKKYKNNGIDIFTN